MSNNTRDKIKKELSALSKEGGIIYDCELFRSEKPDLTMLDKKIHTRAKNFTRQNLVADYQAWYDKALRVVEQFSSNRLEEFKKLYQYNRRPQDPLNVITYSINDYMLGLTTGSGSRLKNYHNTFAAKFHLQIEMIESIIKNLDEVLFNIQDFLQTNLFDSELDAAEELLKHKYFRAAGVLAGVTLESHLKTICDRHKLKIKRQRPSIADLNELLQKERTIDVSIWTRIEALNATRIICAHNKGREPTKEDVRRLIDEVKQIIKTVI